MHSSSHHTEKAKSRVALSFLRLCLLAFLTSASVAYSGNIQTETERTYYRAVEVDGHQVFYRESGNPSLPTLILLHGFPTSSHMFRDLMPLLSDRFHLIAPDMPGFGETKINGEFNYTFDAAAEVLDRFLQTLNIHRYSLYMMDYGAPLGFRLASKYPGRVSSLIVQNGNIYKEGIAHDFWKPFKAYWQNPNKENTQKQLNLLKLPATRWGFTHGAANIEQLNPDAWINAQYYLDQPGKDQIQLSYFLDYRNNIDLYPSWQKYLRDHQPPTLVVWGKNDAFFPVTGAHPYKRDLKTVDFHLLNTGHFALEEQAPRIATLIKQFHHNTFSNHSKESSL